MAEFQITKEQFRAGLQCSPASVDKFFAAYNDMAPRFYINNPRRAAMFLAQVGHETAGLVYLSELWGPTAQQKRYECDPKRIWSLKDERNKLAVRLGNDQPGDGSRYRGRGWLQTTGRGNYRALTAGLHEYLGDGVPNFEQNPVLLAESVWAMAAGMHFWDSHGLNAIADAKDLTRATTIINGGTTGYSDRLARYAKSLEVFRV